MILIATRHLNYEVTHVVHHVAEQVEHAVHGLIEHKGLSLR